MLKPEKLTEKLLYSTIRIRCETSGGGSSVGTGFLFRFPIEGDRTIPLIITNRHVVAGATRMRLRAVEDVLMIGYPIGLSDEVNNFPLIRRGITASHPAIDYCGRSEGVIDAACFAGSSGSPIVLLEEPWIVNKSGSISPGRRFFLLGVLFAGPVMKATGKIETATIPTSLVPVAVTDLMIHLGFYVRSKEIKVLCRHVAEVNGAKVAADF